ncbi:MAG: pyridoxal phosphate-dependent aminotransferase [Candidatus Omnitrophota bacterium]
MNPRVVSLNKSATLKITSLTKKLIKEGKDVINFAAGEPDFDTPEFIKQGAIEAVNQGFTKYTPSTGMPELRKVIVDKLSQDNDIKGLGIDNIIITSGAKYAIFASIFALVDIGEEVIIPAPYWVSYPEIVKLAGAKAVFLPSESDNNFKINIKKLKQAITSKTKVLILNYPSNPTGVTYYREELQEIYETVKDNNIFVISDEIYESLTYDGKEHISFASLGNAGKFTITINGFSKAFSMTGWRMGYLAAPVEIASLISKIIDHTTSCACSISQKAALAAFGNKEWQEKMREEFLKRRDCLYQGLMSIGKLKPFKSQGAFYLFCDIRGSGLTSTDFAARLLEEKLVSCIPADSFGQEGFVRISFSTSLEQIRKGVERITNFLKKN